MTYPIEVLKEKMTEQLMQRDVALRSLHHDDSEAKIKQLESALEILEKGNEMKIVYIRTKELVNG